MKLTPLLSLAALATLHADFSVDFRAYQIGEELFDSQTIDGSKKQLEFVASTGSGNTADGNKAMAAILGAKGAAYIHLHTLNSGGGRPFAYLRQVEPVALPAKQSYQWQCDFRIVDPGAGAGFTVGLMGAPDESNGAYDTAAQAVLAFRWESGGGVSLQAGGQTLQADIIPTKDIVRRPMMATFRYDPERAVLTASLVDMQDAQVLVLNREIPLAALNDDALAAVRLVAGNVVQGMGQDEIFDVFSVSFATQSKPTSDEASLENVDWEHPVFKASFDDASAVDSFVLEGGEAIEVLDGQLKLSSAGLVDKPAGGQANHLVAWLKEEAPADFYLQFDFRPEDKQQGLAILFFNTRGVGGESVFDPTLTKREGQFHLYHSGDLNGYHLSYWSGHRGSSNLRKNKGFHLAASGDDPISQDTSEAFHEIGLYQQGGVIRYFVDGELALEYIDEDKPWTHSGWIGLRQMDHTGAAYYDNLAIYPLKTD